MIRSFIKRLITSEYLSFALRVYLGYFFIYASLSKIPHPAQFAEAIANYRLVPFMFLNLVAVILPWIELVTGLFLIIGFKSRTSSNSDRIASDNVRCNDPDQHVPGRPDQLRVLRYCG